TTFVVAGHHAITATFPGDLFHNASHGTIGQNITAYPSTTTVTASPNPQTWPNPVTLTPTVSTTTPGGATGTVRFFNGTVQIGAAPVGAGGVATITLKLPKGNLTINATYLATTQVATSSGSTTVTVQ